MYKAMKDNKIIAISDTDGEFFCVVKDEVVEDTEHTTADYDMYFYDTCKSEYLLKSEIPAPTHEEQSEKRAVAYQQEVDPITSHIQRLRDEDPDNPEIDELLAERSAKVAEIKERYPYPTEA